MASRGCRFFRSGSQYSVRANDGDDEFIGGLISLGKFISFEFIIDDGHERRT